MSFPSASARTKNWGTEVLIDGDLEGQFDIIHTYINDMMNASTGHDHTGVTGKGPKISLEDAVQDTLPIANGGTGVTTMAALGNLFFPVGSYYFNDSDSTNPGTLLGFGTWVAVEDMMLIGVGSTFDTAGATGGATTVTLEKGNIPAHEHTYASWQSSTGSSGGESDRPKFTSTENTGDGTADGLKSSPDPVSIMNPYRAVYIWRRSA